PGWIVAASPSGRVHLVASGARRHHNRLVEMTTGGTIASLEAADGDLFFPRFAFSPDGRIVAGNLKTHDIALWDALTGKRIGTLAGHRGPLASLDFSPDGRLLISGSSDTTVLLWDYRAKLPAGDQAISD